MEELKHSACVTTASLEVTELKTSVTQSFQETRSLFKRRKETF
jgi:hypothetical protein